MQFSKTLSPYRRWGEFLLTVVFFPILVLSALGQANTGLQVPATPTPQKMGPIEILTDTHGVNFGPYLADMLKSVKKQWYSLIPQSAMPPTLKRGAVVLEFAVQKNGTITALRYTSSSGDVALDRAAYGGVTTSNPLPPLPPEFAGPYLGIRIRFLYNPQPGDEKDMPTVAIGKANPEQANIDVVRLSEILISTNQPNPEHSSISDGAIAAHARADLLLKQLRDGRSFEELAASDSDDAVSGSRGGDLGYFQRGKLAKSLEDVVFAMKPGDISDVIQTKQGFVILKVTEHRGTPQPDLSRKTAN